MFLKFRYSHGQVIFEFAIILAIVAVALAMMQLYLRRGIQAGIKIAADELGKQEGSVELDMEKSSVSESLTRMDSESTRTITHGLGGAHALTMIETSEIIYGFNTYIGGWEEDPDAADSPIPPIIFNR